MCNRCAINTSPLRGEEWTMEDLHLFWSRIDVIGKDWGITYPDQQIEIISASQMIDTMVTLGAPCAYDHWTLGKEALRMEQDYLKGKTGLALELVINSDPSIMYIVENNTLIQQGLVMAHAGIGHGSVFKNNYLFKQWTQPTSILDYMAFSKKYVSECEKKYGPADVELMLDICHALQNYAVSHKEKKRTKGQSATRDKLYSELELDNTLINIADRSYMHKLKKRIKSLEKEQPLYNFPEENICYFLEKHAPLKIWQKEFLRITRKLAEYFYPQTKTKIVHEGWATFIEHRVFEELYARNQITEGGYLEFLRDHSNLVRQPGYDSPYFSGHINPYSIGYYIFEDLYRMTLNPTSADYELYPEICDTKWQESLMEIVKNYNDSDLISRYLTPNVIRKLQLFAVETDIELKWVHIRGTANDDDTIRSILADELVMFNRIPRLEIISVGEHTNRLDLKLYPAAGKVIDMDSAIIVGEYIQMLWDGEVIIHE